MDAHDPPLSSFCRKKVVLLLHVESKFEDQSCRVLANVEVQSCRQTKITRREYIIYGQAKRQGRDGSRVARRSGQEQSCARARAARPPLQDWLRAGHPGGQVLPAPPADQGRGQGRRAQAGAVRAAEEAAIFLALVKRDNLLEQVADENGLPPKQDKPHKPRSSSGALPRAAHCTLPTAHAAHVSWEHMSTTIPFAVASMPMPSPELLP